MLITVNASNRIKTQIFLKKNGCVGKGVRLQRFKMAAKQPKGDKRGNRGKKDGCTCMKCKKIFTSDDDKLLQCERCDEWHCTACLNMEDAYYAFMNERGDVHWFCPPCDAKALSSVKVDVSIEECCKYYMDNYETRLKSVETRLDNTVQKPELDNTNLQLESLQRQIKGLQEDVSKLGQKLLMGANEQQEIEKRKTHIILKGIPESNTVPDRDQILELFRALKRSEEDIKKIMGRLGKPRDDNSSRPIKIECKDYEIRNEILKLTKEIKEIEHLSFDKNKIHINPDLTQLQREREFKLRQERRAKIQEDPSVQWVIRKGQVVKGEVRNAQNSLNPQGGRRKDN